MTARPAVAVLQFPGVNCEYETARALDAAGARAEIFRWNRPREELRRFDAFVLPGGFSFEDRVRAGAIAAKEPVMDALAREALAGKPVLGICNGAQVLVEAGLVPGRAGDTVEIALARNRMPGRSGYYSRWVHLRVSRAGGESPFLLRFEDGEVFPVPMAHGEGRFVSRDPRFLERLAAEGSVPLRYAAPGGGPARGFPENPNGSLVDAAAVQNRKGNVLAVMPHPERGAWLRQVPDSIGGDWARRKDLARRSFADLEGPGPGRKVFDSLVTWLGGGGER
jgi:phosphoribosylformylglycinamidine synthase